MAALADQVQVELAERRPEPVRVVDHGDVAPLRGTDRPAGSLGRVATGGRCRAQNTPAECSWLIATRRPVGQDDLIAAASGRKPRTTVPLPSAWTPRTWWGSPCSPATSSSRLDLQRIDAASGSERLRSVVIRRPRAAPASADGVQGMRTQSGRLARS